MKENTVKKEIHKVKSIDFPQGCKAVHVEKCFFSTNVLECLDEWMKKCGH